MVRYAVFLLLLFQLSLVASKRNFFVIFTKLECHNNLPSLGDFECRLEQRGNRSYLSGRALTKTILENLIVRSVIKPNLPHMSQLNRFEMTMDPCLALKSPPTQFLAKVLLKYCRKYLNEMPKSCPPRPNFNYTVTDIYLDEEHIPSFMPEGSYGFEHGIYVNKLLIGSAIGELKIVYFEKRSKGK